MRVIWILGGIVLGLIAFGAVPLGAQMSSRYYMPAVYRDSTPTPTATPTVTPTPTPADVRVRYRAYVEGDGWLPWQESGSIAGTTDQSKRMEAFQAEIVSGPPGVAVRYRAHVENQGWQDWKRNGEQAGTTGQSLAVQAIQIGLENVSGNNFVAVDTYAAEWGWLGHVRDFWVAGTTGQDRRLEAFRLYIRNDKPEPARVGVAYRGTVENQTESGWKRNGEELGTTGQQLRLEAFKVLLYNHPENMGIQYRAKVEGDWQDWQTNGGQAGTVGEGKRIVAFEMALVNPYPDTILSYAGHFQNLGWSEYAADNPAKNNPIVGDPNSTHRLEALRAGVSHAQE